MTPSSPIQATPDTMVALIGDIFTRRGAGCYLGEQVTMAEHMLQCARQAETAGADESMIAAALLHDIGLFANDFPHGATVGDAEIHHGEAGAVVLEPFFPATVTDCVRHHVAAKRYLCAIDPAYRKLLSPSSVRTLELQGGVMSVEEAAAFATQPRLDEIVKVRLWDDRAKVPGLATPAFSHYAPLLQRLVDRVAAEP
ncbi:MAG: HD domain-containing protein [Alphaproteobacteria bacterium]|nr:HD domain-containing protein [Alphaproteobacteria bacterium]